MDCLFLRPIWVLAVYGVFNEFRYVHVVLRYSDKFAATRIHELLSPDGFKLDPDREVDRRRGSGTLDLISSLGSGSDSRIASVTNLTGALTVRNRHGHFASWNDLVGQQDAKGQGSCRASRHCLRRIAR